MAVTFGGIPKRERVPNYDNMWFVSLRPELFLRLPLDSASPWTPLPLACTWSLPTRAGDFHPRMKRHAQRTQNKEELLLLFARDYPIPILLKLFRFF
jgi:hypothetical protein